MSREEDEEREQLRKRELEEILEVQSLRRIISAYLNYPDASEEDVRRYERSFRKLSPAHRVLISHYPLKFQKIRRCISVNTSFIYNMLQAFEPPLDMSLGMDGCEHGHVEDSPHEKTPKKEKAVHSFSTASPCGNACCGQFDQPSNGKKVYGICKSPKGLTDEREVGDQHACMSVTNNGPAGPKSHHAMDKAGSSVRNVCHNESEACSCTESSGNAFSSSYAWLNPSLRFNVPLVDVDKVRCIIRNIVRDWAAEGQKERDECYKPILEELDSLFPNRRKESPPSCLVPGAGLGRLALEISSLGFICQGNEFSYYMMICSNYILNLAQTAGEWTIHPWIHSNCNSLADRDQLRPVSIPDIHPASAGITDGFSMCGGDFVEVYSDPSQAGSWDAVVTCFFLDTAHNIIEYIEIISRIVKDGGVWINFGPLLYHFADMYGQQDEMSIELSLEDVKKIAFHYGFLLEKESTVETTYTTNPWSMMQNRYYAAFWIMKKIPGVKKHVSP